MTLRHPRKEVTSRPPKASDLTNFKVSSSRLDEALRVLRQVLDEMEVDVDAEDTRGIRAD